VPVLNNVRYASDSDHSRYESELTQKQTHAPQQNASLLDHLVGASEQRHRNLEAKCFGGLEINHQLELDRLLHRQISWLSAL
jgi:hypothetical protein